MPRRAFKIPLAVIFAVPLCLLIAELYCGTDLYFAAMMALSTSAAGITYNLLGGIRTFGGPIFAMLALGSLVISQFAKVLLGQPADSHMAAPALTATVYATFYVCTIPGAFLFRHLRPPMPRAFEPTSEKQSKALYFIAVVLGCIGTIFFNLTSVTYGNYGSAAASTQFNSSHSFGVALSPFLPFAVVAAIDLRICKTEGRHSFGFGVFLPSMILIINGMLNTVRGEILTPALLYLLTCQLRGFHFRAKHYVAMICCLFLFVFVLSPLELFTRTVIVGLVFQDRIARSFDVAAHANIRQVVTLEKADNYTDKFEDYYYLPGTAVLNRLSRIRMDSNLIAACSKSHYGLVAINIDLLSQIPHFLYRNKPQYGSADLLGKISGVSADVPWNTEPAFTMIGDSFGALGFLGVVVLGIFLLPFTLRVLESAFDPSRPWGTAALVSCVVNAQTTVGPLIATVLITTPIYFISASYICSLIARHVSSLQSSLFGRPAGFESVGIERLGGSQTHEEIRRPA